MEDRTPIFTLPLLSFEPIKFITSRDKTQNINQSKTYTVQPTEILDGKTASDFYKEVISQESSQSSKRVLPSTTKKRAKSKPKNISIQKTAQAKLCSISVFLKYCEENNVSKVQEQLELGFLINSTDNYGWTGLMCASCSGAENVIRLLIDYGANVKHKDGKGRTAEDLAKLKNNLAIVKILDEYRSFKLKHAKSKSETEITNQNSEFDCPQCNEKFRDPKTQHERSIYHQINCGFKGEKTFYHVMDNNKGFQMMLKSGWDQEKGLGPSGSGQKFPVKTFLKRDRYGLGIKANEKPRITHFEPFDTSAVATKKPLSVKKSNKAEKKRIKKQNEREKWKEINFRKEFH